MTTLEDLEAQIRSLQKAVSMLLQQQATETQRREDERQRRRERCW